MQETQSPKHSFNTPTSELARRFGVKSDTIRRNLCVRGHYLGLQPIKMSNGRNLWPDVYPEQLAEK